MIDPHRLRLVLRLASIRWLLLVREPGALFWTFGFPILLTIALGVAFRARGPSPEPVAVLRTPSANAEAMTPIHGVRIGSPDDLAAALGASPDLTVSLVTDDEALRGLRSGQFGTVIVPGAPVVFRIDPARKESRLAKALAEAALEKALGRADPAETEVAVSSLPGSRYVDFLVPGLLGMTLMSSSLWGIGYVLADMRTKRLLKRLVATPLRRSELLGSFVLMRIWLLALEVPPLLVAGYFLFGIRVYGSFFTLAFVSLFGAAIFTAIALLVASRASNSNVITGLINFVQMPMILTSGVFFSAEKFPGWLAPYLRLLPLTAMNDALRRIMIEGASLSALGRELLVMGAWGGVSFLLAIRLFRYE